MPYYVEGLSKVPGGKGDVRRIGEYETLADAVKAAEQVIDGFLQSILEPDMTAADLFSKYNDQGEIPFIFRDGDRTVNVKGFNHFSYAMTRCGSICAPKVTAAAKEDVARR
jgi:hypothetical protein